LKRMLRAPLVWGVVLAVGAFWIQEALVPIAETRKNDALIAQISKSSAVQNNLRFRNEQDDGSAIEISAEKFNPKQRTMTKPVVQKFNVRREFEQEISADRATWNPQTGKWRFFNPRQKFWNNQQSQENTTQISGTSNVIEFDAPPPEQLGKKALTRREHLEKGNFEMVSMAELRAWRAALQSGRIAAETKERRKLIDGATFGIQDKIATPLICIALILVGAPLGIRPQRSTGGFAMGLSLAVLLLYYVVWTWATSLGKAGAANPYLMAYLPFGLTLIVGTFLVWKKSR
jgi:lipopolysaccharide export system permease protein